MNNDENNRQEQFETSKRCIGISKGEIDTFADGTPVSVLDTVTIQEIAAMISRRAPMSIVGIFENEIMDCERFKREIVSKHPVFEGLYNLRTNGGEDTDGVKWHVPMPRKVSFSMPLFSVPLADISMTMIASENFTRGLFESQFGPPGSGPSFSENDTGSVTSDWDNPNQDRPRKL